MKKSLIILFIILISGQISFANYFVDKKNDVISKYEIKSIMKEQIKYSEKYDFNALSNLYSEEFKSFDGFNKKVYFKLIEDTWKTYPNITYTTKIKKINVKGNDASVDVHETSSATTSQTEGIVTIYGDLNSSSDGTYFLKKIDNKWQFISERVDNEKSALRYGDTRYLDMDLTSPKTAKAGEYYTASLTVNAPENSFIFASIGKDVITYPQEKIDEVYRKIPDDNILERMFLANSDGKNEYNVASIGISKAKTDSFNNINVYIAGVAFIMTRVNIAGNNNE